MPTPKLELYNGRYYAIWSHERRSERKSMGTSDRAVAEQRFGQWLLLGGHRAKSKAEGAAPSLTIAELWKVYDVKHVQKNTAAPDSAYYSWKNLESHFGELTPSAIDQTVIDDYEDKRVDGEIGRASVPSTIRRELLILRACLNWHASPERGKSRLLDKADVPAFKLPDESDPRDRWLTTAEIGAMLAAAKAMHPGETRMSRGERFLRLALETAARKQALLDLTWDRVDLTTGVIHFAVPGRRDTKKRRPSVPISRTLRPVLERMKREAAGNLVLDHGGDVWATVQAIVVRAGLAPKQPRGTGEAIKGTGISPHTFRHTAATHMARNGVPLWKIAKILGNTLAMVERVYAKWAPDDPAGTVDMIGNGALETVE